MEGIFGKRTQELYKGKTGIGEVVTLGKVETELERHRRMSLWVAREILPHEDRIRGWFLRNRVSPEDVDELMQEAYCRLANVDAFEAIASPPAYFFSIARNLLTRRLKRAKIVIFEELEEVETASDDTAHSLEEVTHHRMAYDKVMRLIASLPERCRRIVELRKVEGWSQKEIAEHLNITEKAVEKQIWMGVRAVRQAWDDTHHLADEKGEEGKGRLGRVLQ